MYNKHQRFKRSQICNAIRELIISENLNIGDKLGAERVLAEKMNVQRLTVRRAIKELCEEGILEQRPNSGTYVKKKVEIIEKKDIIENHESVFSPTGNILISRPNTVIKFDTRDTLPEQLQGWDHIFGEFSKRCPGISVKHYQGRRISQKRSDYDCTLGRPIDLQARESSNIGMLFPRTWYSAHSTDSFLPDKLVKRINNYSAMENGFSAVPLMLTFPVQAINNDLLESHHLPMPPSRENWKETEKWLKSINSVDGLVPPNPCVHSPLNHLCRINKNIVESNYVDLNCEGIREFLSFMKDLWQETKLSSFMKEGLSSLSEAFIDQKMISLELFLNLIPNIQKQSKSKIKVVANTITPAGMTQILPRYLFMGNNTEKYYEILEFSQFLTSNEGQNLLAEQGFGIPYYNGRQGAELFCSTFQVDLDELKKELNNADGFYENIFFKSGFQERIIIPTLTDYFNDGLTIDRTIENIKSRTEQLYNLFYGNITRRDSKINNNFALTEKTSRNKQLMHLF